MLPPVRLLKPVRLLDTLEYAPFDTFGAKIGRLLSPQLF